MNKKRLVVIALSLILAVLLIGILIQNHIKSQEISAYNTKTISLTALEVLEHHIQFQNDKKDYLLDLTLSDNQKNVDFKLYNIEFIEIISIEEKGYDEIARDYVHDNISGEITSFDVKLNVRYIREEEDRSGIKVLRYILIKEDANSPWVVYNWGVNF